MNSIYISGFNTSYQFDFPIIGRGGVDLSTKFKPHPRSYLATTVDGFPNWFQCLGPNSGTGAGSLLIIMERQVDYAVEATLKLQRERLKSIEVKAEAVLPSLELFPNSTYLQSSNAYVCSYTIQTVYGEKCRSWYKAGKEEGRVVAIWPGKHRAWIAPFMSLTVPQGSPLHCARALAHPRWEDYVFEPLDNVRNRFYWLGDGHTMADSDGDGDSKHVLDSKVFSLVTIVHFRGLVSQRDRLPA